MPKVIPDPRDNGTKVIRSGLTVCKQDERINLIPTYFFLLHTCSQVEHHSHLIITTVAGWDFTPSCLPIKLFQDVLVVLTLLFTK